jgi:hypothetical protein
MVNKSKKESRTLDEDIYKALYHLQEMNDSLQKYEPFSDILEMEGRKSLQNLAEWKIENTETQNYVEDLIHMLNTSLMCNTKIKKEKERVWTKHINPTGQQSF